MLYVVHIKKDFVYLYIELQEKVPKPKQQNQYNMFKISLFQLSNLYATVQHLSKSNVKKVIVKVTFNNLSQEFAINNTPNNDTKVKFNEFMSSIDEKTEPNTSIKIEVMTPRKRFYTFEMQKALITENVWVEFD